VKNRWVQLCGSLAAMLMIANLQYAWTLFVHPIQAATGWRLSEIQWGFTLFVLFQTWVMPLDGWLIDRMGARVFITGAGVLCGAGWTALGFVRTLPELYAFYALAGVGAAFVYSGSISAALKWFPDRRGLAAGIIAAGFGSGAAIFVPIIAAIIRRDDYQHAFLYTGIVQGIVIVLAAQVLRKPGPEVGQRQAGRKHESPNVRRNPEQFTTFEMLRTPHFYWMYGMFVMMATGGLLVTAQAAPMARAWRIGMPALTAALALNPVANGASRIFWGWLSDRLGRENTMAIAFTLQAACLANALWLGRLSGTLFMVSLILIFFTWGEVFSLFPSTIGDYYGTRHATSNYCFLYSAKGVASIIGGGVGALLFEWFGSWTAAFYGSAVLALAAGLAALALKSVPLPVKKAGPMRSAMKLGEAISSSE
jgi:MFS transporter, OFA family, oxalate/formate antiporter